ncbi:aldose 1-epimerase family protein [Lactobacillus delbrueckii subsp. bulgaricus]|nr:aldose epimerase [Lactobacillus delbrueckii subsp. bulgaricus]MBT8826606.1 aldose epimerase [Lactobacillus delbrueckii subsp. bulgaricus]
MDYTIENEILKVTVSSRGAELQSVIGKHIGNEYIWQADPEVWGRHAPVLFPIVGKLKNDEYSYQGQTYHMGQHGFARNMEFALEEQTKEKLTFLLTDTEETRVVYPFKFEFRVSYELLNNMIKESFHVTNKGEGDMIFGVGGHPGFALPVEDGVKKDDFYLQVNPAKPRVQVPLEGGLLNWEKRFLAPTESLITITDDLFKDDAMVLVMRHPDNKFSIKTETSRFHINVRTDSAPYVGIWSQYPKTADYVCIEPWWGIADLTDTDGDLEDKKGMNRLASGEDFEASFRMSFHSKVQSE